MAGETMVHSGWVLEPWYSYSTCRFTSLENTLRQENRLPAGARDPKDAIEDMWRALSSDQLRAEALDKTGTLVEIAPREWSRLELFEEGGKDVLKYNAMDIPSAYTESRLKRSDVTCIWTRSQPVAIDIIAAELGDITEQNFGLVLTDVAYVPFSVAVCWIATKGGLKNISIRDEAEWKRAAASLLSDVSAARIDVIGCGDDQESKPLPGAAFDSVDYPHPYSSDIRYYLAEQTHIRSSFYSTEDDLKNGYDDRFFLEGKRRPHWTRLRVRRSQILESFPEPLPTGNLEVECRKWLIGLMRAHPKRPKTKPDLFEEARAKFPGLGSRQFDRAWLDAIQETGRVEWSRKGPVAKD